MDGWMDGWTDGCASGGHKQLTQIALRLPPHYHAPPPASLEEGIVQLRSARAAAASPVLGNVKSCQGTGFELLVDRLPTLGRNKYSQAVLAVFDELSHVVLDMLSEGASDADGCDMRSVHVALAGDRRHMEGLLAAVNSVIKSTASPHAVCLHLFCLEKAAAAPTSHPHWLRCASALSLLEQSGYSACEEENFLKSALRCSFPAYSQSGGVDKDRFIWEEKKDFLVGGAILRIHTFVAEEVTAGLPVQGGVVAEAGDLNAPHNFIRFRLGE
eukprot:2201911-Amphidinium_carterae.3